MIDVGTIFLLLALLIFVGVYISRPLIERNAPMVSGEEQSRSALLAERDRLLDAIRELDFDHAVGKIPAEDYPAQRARLLQRGADVLRQLDEHETGSPDLDVDSRLEAAIAARRVMPEAHADHELDAQAVAVADTLPDDDLEKKISARRRAQEGKAAGFCPRCGQVIQQDDKFCANCGATII